MRREGVHGILYVHNACNKRLGKSSHAAIRAMLATVTTQEKRKDLSKRLAVVLTQCTDPATKVKFNTQLPSKLCKTFELCDVPLIWYDDFSPSKSWYQKLGSWIAFWSFSWRDHLSDWAEELPSNIMPIPSETEREILKRAHRRRLGQEAEEIEVLEAEIERMKGEYRQNLKDYNTLKVDLEHGFAPAEDDFKLAALLKESEILVANIVQMEKRLAELKGKSEGCFSPDTMVVAQNNTQVAMKNLQVGAIVKTRKGWAPVTTFLHRHGSETVEAVRLKHESGSLILTPNHLIFVTNEAGKGKRYTAAENVGSGMYLVGLDDQPSQVLSVETVTMNGYYAPLTNDGTIIVDGVVASCYMQDTSFPLAHWTLHAMTKGYEFLNPDGLQKVPDDGLYHSMITEAKDALSAVYD